MILDALDQEGGINYLRKLARTDQRTFCQLVRAVLPREFKVDAGATFEDILLASFNRPRPAAPPAQPGPPGPPGAAPPAGP
jgi:hypothetical protein